MKHRALSAFAALVVMRDGQSKTPESAPKPICRDERKKRTKARKAAKHNRRKR